VVQLARVDATGLKAVVHGVGGKAPIVLDARETLLLDGRDGPTARISAAALSW